jgi:hypothetical protein
MAKPRELYSGAAPQAMSLMGMGIADAYANAGRIQGQGYAAMGQGIAQGISTIGSVAGDYMKQSKEIERQNKSYEKLLSNEMGQKFLGLSPETADGYLAMLKDEKPSVKNKLLSQFFDQSIKAKMFGMEQAGKEKLQGMSDTSATDRTKINVLGGIAQAGMTAQARQKPPLPAIKLDDPYSLEPAPAPTQEQQPPRVVQFDPQEILPQQQGGLGVSPNDVFYKFLEDRNIAPSEFDKWLNSLIPSRRPR